MAYLSHHRARITYYANLRVISKQLLWLYLTPLNLCHTDHEATAKFLLDMLLTC